MAWLSKKFSPSCFIPKHGHDPIRGNLTRFSIVYHRRLLDSTNAISIRGEAFSEIVIPGRRHFYTELRSLLFGEYCTYKRRNARYAHDPSSLYWTEYIRSQPSTWRKRMPWIADAPENGAPPESEAGTSENHQPLENPVMVRYLISR